MVNDDTNKTFGAVLRTPVENSKGIPHILEHSVLCGSRKYPIKEPFVELMKGSLNTFLNAFTYPDRTCYPVASANLQVQLALFKDSHVLTASTTFCTDAGNTISYLTGYGGNDPHASSVSWMLACVM